MREKAGHVPLEAWGHLPTLRRRVDTSTGLETSARLSNHHFCSRCAIRSAHGAQPRAHRSWTLSPLLSAHDLPGQM